MSPDAATQRCVLVAFRWLAALFLSLPVHAEPVAQAQAHHGGTIVLTERRGSCPAGHMLALDIRPAGRGVPFVQGCAIGVEGGIAITWRGWPRAFLYPRAAFRAGQRNLSWLD